MTCRRESPRLLYRGKKFTPVQNLAMYHVNAKQTPVLEWNRSPGKLEREVHAQCLQF